MTTPLTFDHVGIVARDADDGTLALARLIGATMATRRFDDATLTVSVRFLRDTSGVIFELIAPFGSASIVDGALRKGANIINQIAYRTPDLRSAAKELIEQGCMPLGDPKPAQAFAGAPVQFFLSRLGFIIELIGASGHRHEFLPLEPNHVTRSIP
jgi:methylmalonyl-CoA/ethylmalonyl-CoA epimerase